MTDEKKPGRNYTPIIVTALIIILLIGAGIFLLKKAPILEEKTVVGYFDQDKIVEKDPRFVSAGKQINQFMEDSRKKAEETASKLDPSDPKYQEKLMELEMGLDRDIMTKRNEILNPLNKQVESAIANIALKKGFNVVLSKKIVVCGGEDITDEVLKMLSENKDISVPPSEKIDALVATSKIGYFDAMVVSSLKDFRNVDRELEKASKTAKEEFDKKVQKENMSDQEQAQLRQMMLTDLQKYEADLKAPIFRKVNRVTEKVAKDKNLSLVVNKLDIMYGGVNVTDEVVEQMIGKTTATE